MGAPCINRAEVRRKLIYLIVVPQCTYLLPHLVEGKQPEVYLCRPEHFVLHAVGVATEVAKPDVVAGIRQEEAECLVPGSST